VILAKTIKGYGMGVSGEGQNITHQQKKMTEDALLAFRDRFELPLSDAQARAGDLYLPPPESPELIYLRERRSELGGALPARRRRAESLAAPPLERFQSQLDGTGEREISTTMAFVRILSTLVRDREIGSRIVPIVPDESRTFGMEGMFRQLGIFSQVGQLYQPEDSEQLMFYREDRGGQILQEGINEPGAFSSWIAAATSYSNHGVAMIPFYVFYSMFGFQRVGDLAWAAGDSRARGFLIGGTAGRTTLNGEGLQHEDGHSQLVAATIPNCRAYDPTFAYELAVIVQDGLRRLIEEQEDAFYYLTVMNENYAHPPLPEGSREGILRGMHRISAPAGAAAVRLLGAGAILREVIAGAELLREDFGVDAEVWSVTSFSELAREGMAVDRDNRLHPTRERRRSYVEECLGAGGAPVLAASDYVRAVAEQIRPFLDAPYTTLGTDGFGRSDYRRVLRRFFEVDRHHVALGALHALGRSEDARRAIERYDLDTEAAPPWTR
jgi:pyruvate dehydrogenase E1 component